MKRLKHIFLFLSALPVFLSCSHDAILSGDSREQAITLEVSLDKRLATRAAVEAGSLDGENYIINGDYGIFLGLKQFYLPQVHCCRFTGNRRGLIYPVTDGKPSSSPLKWSDENVYPAESFDFILDNMGYDKSCRYDEDTWFLGWDWTEDEKDSIYAAQREQYGEDGTPLHTNDIIWGKGTAEYGVDGKTVSFVELTHRMTRINVGLVDLETLNEEQRKGMTITISNLVLSAESFNRYDGTVAIAGTPERRSLKLKDAGEDLISRGEGSYHEYDTYNFILPPQPLDDDNWPEVIVTYPADGTTRTVKGRIPRDILNEDNSWETLDRLHAGNHLTVVAKIDDKIPNIIFTAKVKKWIDLGTMTVTAGQCNPGINSMEELKECIELYNRLPQFAGPTDFSQSATLEQKLAAVDDRLLQYGTCEFSGGVMKWTFSINFPLEGQQLPIPGFRNMLWSAPSPYHYPLTLVSDSNDENILNQLKGQKGIYNIEDLNAMIAFVNELEDEILGLYGTVVGSTFTFELRNNIEGEVPVKMKDKIDNITIQFKMIANGFKVNGSDDVNTLIEGKQ